MTPEHKQDQRIPVMATDGMKKRVEEQARRKGISVGKLFRRAMLEYIEREEGQILCSICWENLGTPYENPQFHTHNGVEAREGLWW
jgi:hypothetical protein